MDHGTSPNFLEARCAYQLLDTCVWRHCLLGTSAPPQQGAGLNLERVSEDSEGAGTCITYNANLSLSISQQKQRLPIFQVLPTTCLYSMTPGWPQHRNEILYLLENYRTLVIVGETGSGKTTQVPQVTWVFVYKWQACYIITTTLHLQLNIYVLCGCTKTWQI